MRAFPIACLALATLLSPALAQEGERTHTRILEEILPQMERLAEILSSIQSEEDAKRVEAELETTGKRVQALVLEMRGLGKPSQEVKEANAELFQRAEEVMKRIQTEYRRARGIPGASPIVRKLAFLALADKPICMNNLKQIGIAIVLYQDRNRDSLPALGNPSFLAALLGPDLIEDAKVFICRGSDDEPAAEGEAFRTSYTTWSKGEITREFLSKNRSAFPIVWDANPANHDGRRCVLFLDAHIEEKSEEEFQALLARWKAEGFEE